MRAPIWNVERRASAERSMDLAAGQDTEEKADADGNGYGLERIAPDCLFGFARGRYCLVLSAVQLRVGGAADGRGQVLEVAANRIDLIRDLGGFGAAGPAPACAGTVGVG